MCIRNSKFKKKIPAEIYIFRCILTIEESCLIPLRIQIIVSATLKTVIKGVVLLIAIMALFCDCDKEYV